MTRKVSTAPYGLSLGVPKKEGNHPPITGEPFIEDYDGLNLIANLDTDALAWVFKRLTTFKRYSVINFEFGVVNNHTLKQVTSM